MKKVTAFVAAAALLFAGSNASAQSLLSKIFGNSSSSSTLSNIVNNVAGTVFSAPVSLDGTYTYNGSAVSVSSSEGNVLTNLAGTAVTGTAEAKVDEYLAKVGIKPGAFTWTFNKDDETFTLNAFGINIPGKYKVGDAEKTVNLTFGKTFSYLSMTGNLESTSSGAKMVFQANKLLAFMKKVASIAGKNSAEVAAITKLADNYDNFKVGFKLTK